MAHDVFLSYSATDKSVADAVCHGLEEAGIRCWMASRDILPSETWAGAIVNAINNSSVMVLVFSGEANRSAQVLREVERAINKRIPIIPFRIEDVVPTADMEYFLSAPHWLDAMSPPLERNVRRLVETVRTLIRRTDSTATMPDADESQQRPARQHSGAVSESATDSARDAASGTPAEEEREAARPSESRRASHAAGRGEQRYSNRRLFAYAAAVAGVLLAVAVAAELVGRRGEAALWRAVSAGVEGISDSLAMGLAFRADTMISQTWSAISEHYQGATLPERVRERPTYAAFADLAVTVNAACMAVSVTQRLMDGSAPVSACVSDRVVGDARFSQGGGSRGSTGEVRGSISLPTGVRPDDYEARIDTSGAPEHTPELRTTGEKLYGRYCSVCHGESGEGNGALVVARRIPFAPDITRPPATERSDAYLLALLEHGRGLMPSVRFGEPSRPHHDPAWAIIAHVRKLQGRR